LFLTGHSFRWSSYNTYSFRFDTKILKNLVSEKNLFVFTYGSPRIGNEEFANFADSQLKINRIVNFEDPVPRLPPRFLDYQQSSKEIWISDPVKILNGGTVECQGQEDPNCSLSNNPLHLNIKDHNGPYFGVRMRNCSDINKNDIDNIDKLLVKALNKKK
jgi:hypothetical protein